MKINSNVPKAIREGIFCFMTGAFVFMANGITADAQDVSGNDDGNNADASNGHEIGENLQNEAFTEQEASELISVPEQPGNSQTIETIDENSLTVTKTTENSYAEATENAVATTDETVVETTETTTIEGNTRNITTVESNSTTNIATSDENLAKEIISQVEAASLNNTEEQGINLGQVTEQTFIDNAREDQAPVALNDQQAAELENVVDGTVITVETTNGQSTVLIGNEEAALSTELTDIIVNSAKENVISQSRTYAINGQEVSAQELGSLELNTLGANTDFTITNNDGIVTITYIDANGDTRGVTDPELKNRILSVAENVSNQSVVEEYKGLVEYENSNDPELIAERDRLESIGYTNIRLIDGTGTYVVDTIPGETFRTLEEAQARQAELERNGYTVNVSESSQKYIADTISNTFDTLDEANAEKERLEALGYQVSVAESSEKYIVSSISKPGLTKAEADAERAQLEKDGYTVFVEKGEGTYIDDSISRTGLTKEEAESIKNDLENKGYVVTVTDGDGDYTVTGDHYEHIKQDQATSYKKQLEDDGYKVTLTDCDDTYRVDGDHYEHIKQDHATSYKKQLEDDGFKVTLSDCDDTYRVTGDHYEHIKQDQATSYKKQLEDDGYKVTLTDCDDTYRVIGDHYEHIKQDQAKSYKKQLEDDGYRVTLTDLSDTYRVKGDSYYHIKQDQAASLKGELEDDGYKVTLTDLSDTYFIEGESLTKEKQDKVADLKAKLEKDGYVVNVTDCSATYWISGPFGTDLTKAEYDELMDLLKNPEYKGFEIKVTNKTDTEVKNLGECKESEKAAKEAALIADGYTNINFTEITSSSASEMIQDFGGFSVTTQAEYERITALPQKQITVKDENNEDKLVDAYCETKDGVTYYYLAEVIKFYNDQTHQTEIENYTILARTGSIGNHQQGAYIITGEDLYAAPDNDPQNNSKTSSMPYDVDFDQFESKMNDICSVQQTDDNTLSVVSGGPDFGDKKYHISAGGTYYLEASSAGRIYVSAPADEEVYVVLYNGNKGDTVYVPIATNRDNYQPNNQTGWGAANTPYGPTFNITFVSKVPNLIIRNSDNNGNVLATDSTVSFEGWGNFCGTIVCNEINNPTTEGHTYYYGYKAYQINTRKVVESSEKSYTITGNQVLYTVTSKKQLNYQNLVSYKELNFQDLDSYMEFNFQDLDSYMEFNYQNLTSYMNLNYQNLTSSKLENYQNLTSSKQETNQNLSAVKLADKQDLSAVKTANKQELNATKEVNMMVLTAEKTASKQVLAAERTVENSTSSATLTITDYSKTATSLDRTFGIEIIRYSAQIDDPVTDTPTNELPPDTPTVTPPDTPTVTPPDTPTVTPPDTPVVPPTIIIDDATPLAGDVAQVLGARRATGGPAVLGARRARTGDMAHNPLVSTLIMMGASATALGLLLSLKKRR